MAHEESSHPNEHLVTLQMTVVIVVQLEVVDVDEDAAVICSGIVRQRRLDLHQAAPIEGAGERIVRAHLEELRLERFARRDVDQNTVKEFLASHRIAREVTRIEGGSRLAVRTANRDLELAHRPVAVDKCHLLDASRRVDDKIFC